MEFLEFKCMGKNEQENERSEKESTRSSKTSEKESTRSTEGRQEFRDFNENTEKSV